jgi:hypothetical protein
MNFLTITIPPPLHCLHHHATPPPTASTIFSFSNTHTATYCCHHFPLLQHCLLPFLLSPGTKTKAGRNPQTTLMTVQPWEASKMAMLRCWRTRFSRRKTNIKALIGLTQSCNAYVIVMYVPDYVYADALYSHPHSTVVVKDHTVRGASAPNASVCV